jgi:hypothetical protein
MHILTAFPLSVLLQVLFYVGNVLSPMLGGSLVHSMGRPWDADGGTAST